MNTITKTVEKQEQELQSLLSSADTSYPITEVEQTMDLIEGISDEMQPRRPKSMTTEQESLVKGKVSEWMELIKQDPASLKFSTDIYQLGDDVQQAVIPHTRLYDTLIADVMAETQKGAVEGSREYNLLQYKRQMDMVNPAVLATQPVPVRFFFFFKKMELPGTDKVLDIIYENRETVKSAIDGIKFALLANSNDLDKKLADLIIIYDGMRKADRMLKDNIYFAQLLHVEIHRLLKETDEGLARTNLETILADLTTQVNNLLVKENMYVQFFAGSQMTAKMIKFQQNNIKTMVGMLQDAVLANLGLKVVSTALAKSVEMTEMLGDTIANTIVDTGLSNEKTAAKLRDVRVKGNINIDKLKEGIDAIERTMKAEAKANQLVIEKGIKVAKEVSEMTDRIDSRLDQNDNALSYK